MPISCKCILDRMVFKGAMTEEERDKIVRNLKGTEWHSYPDEKPKETKEYNITIKNPKHTTTAAYFTEDDTWYGGNDFYVPRECISAWAELPESYDEIDDREEDPDLVAKRILAKLSGLPVSDTTRKHVQKIIFGDRPAEKCWSLTGDYFENDVLAPEAVHDSKNEVIVVQIDCLMPMENVMAFRKDLLAQMKDGIIVIPPWAHVSHVGGECKIEIKEMKEKRSEETN